MGQGTRWECGGELPYLAVLNERPVGLEDDEAAVHVLQQVELALQDDLDTVGELRGGEGIAELVLDDGRAGVDEPGVGNHTKLLHLHNFRLRNMSNLAQFCFLAQVN